MKLTLIASVWNLGIVPDLIAEYRNANIGKIYRFINEEIKRMNTS